jgi:hypothetical protein
VEQGAPQSRELAEGFVDRKNEPPSGAQENCNNVVRQAERGLVGHEKALPRHQPMADRRRLLLAAGEMACKAPNCRAFPDECVAANRNIKLWRAEQKAR